MYKIIFYNSFQKDIKRCKKRNLDFLLLTNAIDQLETKGILPKKYRVHKLTGNYKGRMECHIKPDWLLIWIQDDQTKTLYFERTGTHADLFK